MSAHSGTGLLLYQCVSKLKECCVSPLRYVPRDQLSHYCSVVSLPGVSHVQYIHCGSTPDLIKQVDTNHI